MIIMNVLTAVTLWCTNIYYDSIQKIFSLEEGSFVYGLWTHPAVPRVISVYPFNYTNVNAVKKGFEVPHVQELGPYVYRERTSKVNIKFHSNGTLTFQENRTHEYASELSKGSLSDVIILPNFPVLAAHNLEGAGMLEYSGAAILKLATFSNDFLKLSINDIIWGYDDSFTRFGYALKSILKPSDEGIKKFGILTVRSGLNPDRVTIGTGNPDMDSLSVISRYNGKSSIGAWNDEKCDKIEGTDSSLFPKRLVVPNTTLNIFSKELCRNLPLVYEKEILNEEGIPAYRYRLPGNVFASPDKNPDNKCYCKNSACPPCGTFNTAPCNFRVPVLMSYPHFTHADPKLREKVTGLTPDPDKYQTLIDIHKMGIPVYGVSRFQVNMFINRSPWLNVKDGTVLPLAWIEVKMGEMTDFLTSLLHHLSYTVPRIEIAARYSSLFFIVISPSLIYFMLKRGKYKAINLR